MNATHLGFYNTASTRTHVRFQFSTHAAAGGNVAPSSAFEAADLRVYRAADGAAFSATQRSSANGITMTSPFDSLTGFHDVDIDLTDNTDAGFYAAGYLYTVVLAPDETVDSATLTGVVLAYFEVGVRKADVTHFGGTAGTFASGIPETKVASIAANAITATAIASDAITDAKVASDVTIASITGNVGGNVVGSVGSLAAQAKADVNAEVVDVLTVDLLADSVHADGTRPTLAQAVYEVIQYLTERSVSGTTVTVKKVDGSTSLCTLTINDATSPTSITRS